MKKQRFIPDNIWSAKMGTLSAVEELKEDQDCFNHLDIPDLDTNFSDLEYDMESDNFNIPFNIRR